MDPTKDAMARTYTISELSRELGLTTRAIRFYEDKGLIEPVREGLNRIFSNRDRARLILIKLAKRFGFSLIEIKEMLDLYELPDGGRAQTRVVLEKAEQRLEAMRRQRDELDRLIDELAERCADGRARLQAMENAAASPPSEGAIGRPGPVRSH